MQVIYKEYYVYKETTPNMCTIKVARLAKSVIYISLIVGYFVTLSLQNPGPENNILVLHLDTEILNVKVGEINNFDNSFLFIFSYFVLDSVANMVADYMHKIEIKILWK